MNQPRAQLTAWKVIATFLVGKRYSFVFVCFGAAAWGLSLGAVGDRKVIATGIVLSSAGAYRWCGSDRLLLSPLRDAKGRTLREAVFLDLRTMRQVPAGLTDEQGRQLNVDLRVCDENKIVAWRPKSAAGSANLGHVFAGPSGQTGKLLASLKDGGTVSLKGKYIVANTPKILTGDGYRVDQECATYHDPSYNVLCWDTWLRALWPLSRYVVAEYTWQDYVSVEAGDGKRKQVKNQEPPLIVKDGKPVASSILLRDLGGRVLANLSDDPVFSINRHEIVSSADEAYVYSPCKNWNGFDGGDDGVCRYSIDGLPHKWERVFSFDVPKKEKTGMGHIDIGVNGDIYFAMPGARPAHRGIWMYDTARKEIKQLTRVESIGQSDTKPKISPDGKRVAFTRPEQGQKLFIVEKPGG